MKNINDAVSQLAVDLDKSVSGEEILDSLLTGLILLKRENAELKAQLDQVLDKLLVLTALVDSDHASILRLQGQQHQTSSGGIVH